MYNGYAVPTRRWTPSEITAFYDEKAILRIRRRCAALWALAMLAASLIQPLWYFAWLACALILGYGTDYWARSPARSRAQYELLRTQWDDLLEKSSPKAQISTTANLAEGEVVIYSQPSQRFVNRVINGTVISAPVDSGELVVTTDRVLFLGEAQTLAIRQGEILRYPPLSSGTTVTFEYAQRPAGENFSVKYPLFQLCMNRRGHFTQFVCDPPAPLPLEVADLSDEHLQAAGVTV